MARKAVGTKFLKFGEIERAAYLELRSNGVGKMMAAKGVGVDYSTVAQYRAANPEWDEFDRKAAGEANEQVSNAMFQTALKGNVTAQQVWLYNRDPDNWKDRRTPKDSGDESFDLARMSEEERRELRQALNKAFAVEAQESVGRLRSNGILPHEAGGVLPRQNGHHVMEPDR